MPDEGVRAAMHIALEHVPVAVEIASLDGRLEYVNSRFTTLTGYTSAEAIGRTAAELLRSDVHDPRFFEQLEASVAAGKTWRGELVSRRKDGRLVRLLTTVVPIANADGSVSRLLVLKQSLGIESRGADGAGELSMPADLVDTVARLEASELRYRTMMRSAGDAILISDVDSAYWLEVNEAACQLFGHDADEFRRLTGRMLTVPGQDELIAKVSSAVNREGRAFVPKMELQRADGSTFWASLRVSVYELGGRRMSVNTIRDISDQIEREAELREVNRKLQEANKRLARAERLAALGKVSATVAHEINNPLQFVEVNLERVQRHLDDSRAPAEVLAVQADVRDGVERIAGITRDLGRFARVERGQLERLRLDDVVEQACRLVYTQVHHCARFERCLGARTPVVADRGKLVQLVTNLVVNAAHAIEEGQAERNRITVRTTEDEGILILEVEDTGVGIAPERLEQIFDPFFTTKPRGSGTGLGLAVCVEVVHLHQGTIDVESQPGQGTRFTVRLPVDNGLVAQAVPQSAEAHSRRGRVLLIDDDPLVLRAFSHVLRGHHDVVEAEGGERAIQILQQDRRFDVILCDLMMPVIDGVAVHETLESQAPSLVERVVFCSGGAFTPRAQAFATSVSNRLLEKPVRPAELRRAIAEAMAQTGPSRA